MLWGLVQRGFAGRRSAIGRAGATLTVLLLVLPAPAADIAGNDGWLPLSEAVARYGIDPAFVDQALDAGGELGCIRTGEDGQYHYASLNGWFVAGDMGRILTNAHFMYSKDAGGQPDAKQTDFSNCHVATNRDVLSSPNSSKYRKLTVDPNPAHYVFGSSDPAGDDVREDRATVPLVDGAPEGAYAFEDHPELFDTLKPSSDIYMLSTGRFLHGGIKGGFEPVLQHCTVLAIEPSEPHGIGVIKSNCDNQPGMSASRIFVPVTGSQGSQIQLLAVGIHSAGGDGPPDLPPDPITNSSTELATNKAFYWLPCSGAEIVERAGASSYLSVSACRGWESDQ